MAKTHPISITKEHQEHLYDYEANPPIGIDLGTSNSVIARWVHTVRRTGAEVYHLNKVGKPNRNKLMSSIVYLEEEDNSLIVGQLAFAKRLLKPELVASAIKARIGESQKNFILGKRRFSATELSAYLIKGLFDDVLRQGLEAPTGIVVSVPYYFKQHQNTNTRRAAEEAIQKSFRDLPQDKRPQFLGLIPEPIAASLDYAFRHLELPLNEIVLICDMGGGTLDLTLVRLHLTSSQIDLEVLSCEGHASFGGVYFDRMLVDYICDQEGLSKQSLSEHHRKRLKHILFEAALQVKEDLSNKKATDLILTNLPDGAPRELRVSRKDFEAMLLGKNSESKDYCNVLKELLRRNLQKARLSPDRIEKVILIGGSTRIPLFQNVLTNALPKCRLIDDPESTYTAVARGSAIYAAYLLDQTSNSRHLPGEKKIRFISRSSHGLGIETNRGNCKIIIPENSVLPFSKEVNFLPIAYKDAAKDQVLIDRIRVIQGSSPRTQDNTMIGSIQLPLIYAHGRPLNEIKILVTFHLDTTTLGVEVFIPQGQNNGEDIRLSQRIHLEEGRIQ